jgi:hypothetical protein
MEWGRVRRKEDMKENMDGFNCIQFKGFLTERERRT